MQVKYQRLDKYLRFTKLRRKLHAALKDARSKMQRTRISFLHLQHLHTGKLDINLGRVLARAHKQRAVPVWEVARVQPVRAVHYLVPV